MLCSPTDATQASTLVAIFFLILSSSLIATRGQYQDVLVVNAGLMGRLLGLVGYRGYTIMHVYKHNLSVKSW